MKKHKMWLTNNFNNFEEVGKYDTLTELRKAGKKMLKEGASCANGFIAREFAYLAKDKTNIFEWINKTN